MRVGWTEREGCRKAMCIRLPRRANGAPTDALRRSALRSHATHSWTYAGSHRTFRHLRATNGSRDAFGHQPPIPPSDSVATQQNPAPRRGFVFPGSCFWQRDLDRDVTHRAPVRLTRPGPEVALWVGAPPSAIPIGLKLYCPKNAVDGLIDGFMPDQGDNFPAEAPHRTILARRATAFEIAERLMKG